MSLVSFEFASGTALNNAMPDEQADISEKAQ